MGSIPKKSYKIDGCKGSFFLRGKNNIIWYRRSRNERFTTGLEYTPKNRIIAGQRIKEEENKGVLNSDIKTIGQALEYYEQTTKQKKSDLTREQYKYTFRAVFPDHSKLINDFDYIRNRLVKLKNSDRSNVTIFNYYAVVSSLYNHLVKRNIINKSPISREDFPKVQRKIIETFTVAEMDLLFNHFKTVDFNFYLYLRFLYTTAFRMNEARKLKKSQIITDGKFRSQIIIGKSKFGDRTDYFPLTKSIQEIINQIPGIWEKRNDDFVFDCSDKPRPMMFSYLKTALVLLDIPTKTMEYEGKGRSFHTLRKTRITDWIQSGISIHGLEKLSRDTYATVRKYYDAVETGSYDEFVD